MRWNFDFGTRKTLIFLTVLYLLIRLPWMFMVPMVEAPDEFSHFWVIKFLVQHAHLPDKDEVLAGTVSSFYGTLPQFGYVPHVLFAWMLPFLDLSLSARFGSLLMGWICLCLSYFLGRELFPESKLCANALPLMLLFHPQFVLVCAYSNTDSTTCALTTGTLLLLCHLIKRGTRWQQSILLGFLLAWTVLSKYSALGMLPTTLFALAACFYIHKTPVSQILKFAVGLVATFFGCSGWWFVRNYFMYDHDFLGTRIMYMRWAETYHRAMFYHLTPWQVMKQKGWWRMATFSYWGVFGYMNKYMWRPLYFGYIGFMLIATASGAGQAAMALVQSKGKPFKSRNDMVMPAIWTTMILCVLANLSAMVVASMRNLGGPQGRYLFPSEAAIMALMIGGLWNMASKYRRGIVIALVIFNAIVLVYAFCMLFPLYGFRAKPL